MLGLLAQPKAGSRLSLASWALQRRTRLPSPPTPPPCLQEPDGLSEGEAQRLLVAASGKLSVLQQMLPRLLHGGHRVLIFTQSTEVRRGRPGVRPRHGA